MTAPLVRVLIGMEVHLQLATRTKCFSAAPVRFGADPNTLIDPVVAGLPGALPVLNREAVRLAIRTGLALGCQIAPLTRWDRKNYFYPDLPKGYQISQYDLPLCTAGAVEIDADGGGTRRVRIRRAHLEEDTGKATHDEGGDKSRVDLNRAGTPLLEIVSEPDLHSAAEAMAYLEALREIVAYLGTSDGNMQEGNLRCEPNVNLELEGGVRTPIVEIKNLNSVRNVGRAIEYEVARQLAAWRERGETRENTPRSTRGWDDVRAVTVHQRSKESADDYRYFPEPDLLPLRIPAAVVERERAALPELPRARRARYEQTLGLTPHDARVLTQDAGVSDWFEAALGAPGGPRDAREVAKWVTGEVLRHLNEERRGIGDLALAPGGLGELVDLVARGTVNERTAKELLRELLAKGGSPAALVKARGLEQIGDPAALARLCREAVAQEARAWAEVRGGNPKALGRIVGAVMKATGGRADPGAVHRILGDLLREEA